MIGSTNMEAIIRLHGKIRPPVANWRGHDNPIDILGSLATGYG